MNINEKEDVLVREIDRSVTVEGPQSSILVNSPSMCTIEHFHLTSTPVVNELEDESIFNEDKTLR